MTPTPKETYPCCGMEKTIYPHCCDQTESCEHKTPTPKEECCPKCKVTELLSGDMSGNEYSSLSEPICSNSLCDCHSTSITDWSEMIPKLKTHYKFIDGEFRIFPENLKYLLTNLESAIRQQTKKEIIERVEGMKIIEEDLIDEERNQTLDDLLTYLKEE